mmetsp:Transcript_12692/g.18663  ORF Transcript_12692/g.18663 Transcript_12692/m.18663 type:complete len:246 (-) Transcript_12692:147-884(-)|eukprot:CAMPEP_0194213072 /NCGR_PEP_ID=MMETSP0156-20130528/13380_1 /TAXON_ID=33649 /ORGANISM="Thalassionema nitzschioides, Strain L26-B" /LENGTH=245 /DNA_ID=CAMNT_0038941019 /DNA_START=37 /DNA_END=774 /DNA_ORIENTATION=+
MGINRLRYFLLVIWVAGASLAFTTTTIYSQPSKLHRNPLIEPKPYTTELSLVGGTILDVPDNFFTITFPMLAVMLQITKEVNRARLEERAFDLRLKEQRERKLAADPTLTESELIRQDAAKDFSYYGPDAVGRKEENNEVVASRRSRARVTLLERPEDEPGRQFTLSEEEITELESLGLEYDPYYDDPYTEEELPEDVPYRKNGRFGDRIYDNGEIFYRDSTNGLYYRQGSKPRSQSFWASSRYD